MSWYSKDPHICKDRYIYVIENRRDEILFFTRYLFLKSSKCILKWDYLANHISKFMINVISNKTLWTIFPKPSFFERFTFLKAVRYQVGTSLSTVPSCHRANTVKSQWRGSSSWLFAARFEIWRSLRHFRNAMGRSEVFLERSGAL